MPFNYRREYVLAELAHGPKTSGELVGRAVGPTITQPLIDIIKRLEAEGLVERVEDDPRPHGFKPWRLVES